MDGGISKKPHDSLATFPQITTVDRAANCFVDYTADLAQRAAATKPGRVLRVLRDALPHSTRLVVSDLNPAMLEIARQKFADTESNSIRQMRPPCRPPTARSMHSSASSASCSSQTRIRRTTRPFVCSRPTRAPSFEFNPFARIAHETVGRFFALDAPTFFTVPLRSYRIDVIKTVPIGAFLTTSRFA
jgi:hypothetical protein